MMKFKNHKKKQITVTRKINLLCSDYPILKQMKNFQKNINEIINGCKPDYIPKKINLNFKFKECCNRHDFCYWSRCQSRKKCDKAFLKCMKSKKTSWKDNFIIYTYYYLVRLFGKTQYSECKKTIEDFLNLSKKN